MKIGRYVVAFGLVVSAQAACASPQYTTLYQFTGRGSGSNPQAGLIADANGNLYGTTSTGGNNKDYAGTVFELTPPAQNGAKWTLTTLWRFHDGEGASPVGGLVLDKSGALYGTTSSGANVHQLWGTAFKLSPPANGATKWSFERIWIFRANREGAIPDAGLVMDGSGALYGTTSLAGAGHGEGWGTAFKLTPPAQNGGAWTFDRLCFFAQNERAGGQPIAPLYLDQSGNLYGTAFSGGGRAGGDGDAFMLTPPHNGGTAWTRTVIARFGKVDSAPAGGFVPGAGGVLYGTASGLGDGSAGAVYELTPPANGATKWKTTTLFQFNGADGATPFGALTLDGSGGFYGSTFNGGVFGYGTVFHLLPPANGSKKWRLILLHSFELVANKPSAIQPNGGLLLGSDGALYGTAFQDTKYFSGAVFRLDP